MGYGGVPAWGQLHPPAGLRNGVSGLAVHVGEQGLGDPSQGVGQPQAQGWMGQDISLHDCPGCTVSVEELWSGTIQPHWDRD